MLGIRYSRNAYPNISNPFSTVTKFPVEKWYVGESTTPLHEDAHLVCEIEASGAELEHIKARMTNIPLCYTEATCRWFGDMAKMIVGNL